MSTTGPRSTLAAPREHDAAPRDRIAPRAQATGAAAATPARPSSILLKVALAVSGLVLFGFVFVHMIGNLKVYLGAASIDRYSAWLRDLGYPLLPHEGLLWGLRVALLLAVVVHIWAAVVVARRNRAARAGRRRDSRSYAARTMPITGGGIGLFVVFHVLDLTTGHANPDFVEHAVHANIVASFSRWPVALVYVAAVLLLGSHLIHGLWSAFTTLGVTDRRLRRISRGLATGLATAVVVGNASIPLAVQAGLIG